jgi:hypothetical protein
MLLHDPHMIPEPILVLSGLSYLVPSYIAFTQDNKYSCFTYLFLTFTTVGFHGTRNETLFALDCVAIVNMLIQSYIKIINAKLYIKYIYFGSILYSLASYFIGQHYRIMSFHPDWNIQMAYHACMHISTSYSAYLALTQ